MINDLAISIYFPFVNHIPTGIRKSQWIVEAVAVSVVSLRALLVLDNDVGREHSTQDGVVETAIHVDQVEPIVVLMEGVAPVEGVAHVGVAEVRSVATATPRVVAQPFHGAALDGGRQATLVVFQRVVHGSPSSVLCYKDSEDSRSRGEIMQLFCQAVLGDRLVKRSEVALGSCRGTVAEGLCDPLPVDAVVHRQRLAVLRD